MKKFKNNQGITLIALVITIIVLLILAGVSLRLVAGDEGILGRAEKAVSKNDTSSLKEEIELAISEARIAYYEGDIVDGATSASENIAKTLEGGIETLQGTVKLDGESLTISGTEIGTYSAEKGVTIKDSSTGEKNDPSIGTLADWDVSSDGTLTYYKGVVPENGVITIPSVVDGIKVKNLRPYNSPLGTSVCIFWSAEAEYCYNSTIKEVIISDGIESISGWVFAKMKNLASITIPVSVIEINGHDDDYNDVFTQCNNLSIVNYEGTRTQWDNLSNSSNVLKNAQIICKE